MTKVTKNSSNKIDTVFVLMIFCVFAMSVFLVLMLSASTYRNMVDISNEGQNERVAMSYIRTKIRKADTAGAISVSDFNGVSALSLVEEVGGRNFVTLIYYHEGWLNELFHEVGFDYFAPGDGIPIIRVDSLRFDMIDDSLIRITTDKESLLITPRSSSWIGGFN